MRVTNTGLSAMIDMNGRIDDLTEPFKADVRVWGNHPSEMQETVYTREGDLFVYLCAVMTFLIFMTLMLKPAQRATA
jgi:apolipoprotein N-acyltransferase